MQEGIGRGGYRVLAIVFCGLGLLGLALAAATGGAARWVGLLLAAVGLVALAGVAVSALNLPAGAGRSARSARSTRGAPDEDAPVPLPTPEPPAVSDPDADLGFEYGDGGTPASPAPAAPPLAVAAPSPWAADPGPPFEMERAPQPPVRARSLPPPPPRPATRTPPPPMARPGAHSAPPSGKSAADSGWPERRGKAGVTRRQVAERDLPRDPGPAIEVEGPGPVRRDRRRQVRQLRRPPARAEEAAHPAAVPALRARPLAVLAVLCFGASGDLGLNRFPGIWTLDSEPSPS
jgi:hypothetical protein